MLICNDIILKICEFLIIDGDKIRLFATSKQFNNLKFEIRYHTKIKSTDIADLCYFDNFENIMIESNSNRCPKYAKFVELIIDNAIEIPNFVTHLTILTPKSLVKVIPPSVTNLTFKRAIMLPLKNIPSSVTHLTFLSPVWINILENMIPSSVTHLTFHFVQRINQYSVPASVTHITFYIMHAQIIIPNTVSHVTIYRSRTQVDLPLIITYEECSQVLLGCKSFFSGSVKELNIIYYRSQCDVPNASTGITLVHVKQIKTKVTYLFHDIMCAFISNGNFESIE
jgi:hypothetical protein